MLHEECMERISSKQKLMSYAVFLSVNFITRFYDIR